MSLSIQLFGRLQVACDEQPLKGIEGQKVSELLCYLLLHRDRPQPREQLASDLWGDTTTDRSLKSLRQALWQLHASLGSHAPLVVAEAEWVQLHADQLRLDVEDFERAYARSQSRAGADLDPADATDLQRGAALYGADLLLGWNQPWCLLERERLQAIYLTMLDKLMDYCLARGLPEEGLGYGARSLALDWVREATHQRLMHLHYRAGDRTAALRQYERCATALREELGVRPGRRTEALHEAIKADRRDDALAGPAPRAEAGPRRAAELDHLHELLGTFQRQLKQVVAAIEQLRQQP